MGNKKALITAGQDTLSLDVEPKKAAKNKNTPAQSKRFNDLDGKEWTKYSISIWRDIAKNAEEKKSAHPAVFPIELARRVIEIFTKKGETVLDPFVGTGATLLAAEATGRNAIGIEIVPDYVRETKKRLARNETLIKTKPPVEIKVIQGDARHLDRLLGPDSVDFVFTSPPYWNILQR